MKKFFYNISEYKYIYLLYALWLLAMNVLESIAPSLFLMLPEYIGNIPWANFDGMHFVTIATDKYHPFQQAFFPGYPMFIRFFSHLFPLVLPETVAMILSRILFLPALMVFYTLAKTIIPRNGLWSVVLLLTFPTSFFFGAVYTASMFLLLTTTVFLLVVKRHYFIAGIVGAIASGTWVFGVFLLPAAIMIWKDKKEKKDKREIFALLLIPLGLVGYMAYLWYSTGDPLAFVHVQPAFGAGRSGGEIILLPQVLWRYLKILFTATPTTIQYGVAGFELATLLLAIFLLWQGIRRKMASSYLLYALAIIITPTLTGTLSSLPRYFLAAFPLFYILAESSGHLKIVIALVFMVIQVIVASAFLQGHFVS